jgi:hypothetical protein
MMFIRRAACIALAAATFVAPPAYATSFSIDQSDLWYVQAESGWGMQLVQRASVIFATLYVYGPTATPTWYTATLDYTSDSIWTGNLYATTGPYFGAVQFDPMQVAYSPVGMMTWAAQTVETGTLTYSVNGVIVVKNMVRQSLALDDFSGHYAGAFHNVVTGCANLTLNGTFDVMGTVDVTQNGTAISILQDFSPAGSSCTYTGTLSETGQMGSAQLGFTCSDGSTGTAAVDEMQVTHYALGGTISTVSSNPPGCQTSGWFGGVRGTTF